MYHKIITSKQNYPEKTRHGDI